MTEKAKQPAEHFIDIYGAKALSVLTGKSLSWIYQCTDGRCQTAWPLSFSPLLDRISGGHLTRTIQDFLGNVNIPRPLIDSKKLDQESLIDSIQKTGKFLHTTAEALADKKITKQEYRDIWATGSDAVQDILAEMIAAGELAGVRERTA